MKENTASSSAMPRYSAFPPLIGDLPRILILGTFPSPLSRVKMEYYGNPRNSFWRIIFSVFDEPFQNPDYDEKKRILARNHIALWDVIASCQISGAADSSIINPEFNTAIIQLLQDQPSIAKVLFNGGNAYRFYRKGIGDIAENILPSTSPTNARYRFEEKLLLWKEALL